MRLIINKDELYMAHFHHGSTHVAGEGDKFDRTICTVHEGKCVKQVRPCINTVVHIGRAFCSEKDIFNKYKGRKVAFGRAISKFDREVRAQLWAEFLRQNGILPQIKSASP